MAEDLKLQLRKPDQAQYLVTFQDMEENSDFKAAAEAAGAQVQWICAEAHPEYQAEYRFANDETWYPIAERIDEYLRDNPDSAEQIPNPQDWTLTQRRRLIHWLVTEADYLGPEGADHEKFKLAMGIPQD